MTDISAVAADFSPKMQMPNGEAFVIVGSSFADAACVTGQAYYYWVRPVNVGGAIGAYTPAMNAAGATGTPITAGASDLTANAATMQATNNGGGATGIPHYAGGSTVFALVQSVTITVLSVANPIQISFSGTFIDTSGVGSGGNKAFLSVDDNSGQRTGSGNIYDMTTLACPASGTAQISGNIADFRAAGSHTYRLYVATSAASGMNFENADIMVTEIRR
jgi:hypothetical protein